MATSLFVAVGLGEEAGNSNSDIGSRAVIVWIAVSQGVDRDEGSSGNVHQLGAFRRVHVVELFTVRSESWRFGHLDGGVVLDVVDEKRKNGPIPNG